MRVYIIVVGISVIIAFGVYERVSRPLPELPDGYSFMCSTEGRKYALVIPNEDLNSGLPGTTLSYNAYNSKRKAIDYAWYLRIHRGDEYVPETGRYRWEKCE